MSKIEVYVANLGKYNEGKLIGNWFELPCDVEEIMVKVGVAQRTPEGEFIPYKEENGIIYEETAIHDYESPFEIGECVSISELNKIAELMDSLQDDEISIIVKLMDYNIVSGFEEGIDYLADGKVNVYYECNSMTDVAYQIVEENNYLDKLPEHIRFYFDYTAFARDLEIEGTFLYCGNSIIIEVIG